MAIMEKQMFLVRVCPNIPHLLYITERTYYDMHSSYRFDNKVAHQSRESKCTCSHSDHVRHLPNCTLFLVLLLYGVFLMFMLALTRNDTRICGKAHLLSTCKLLNPYFSRCMHLISGFYIISIILLCIISIHLPNDYCKLYLRV